MSRTTCLLLCCGILLNLCLATKTLEELNSELQANAQKLEALEQLKMFSNTLKQQEIQQQDIEQISIMQRNAYDLILDRKKIQSASSSSDDKKNEEESQEKNPIQDQILEKNIIDMQNEQTLFSILPVKQFKSQYLTVVNQVTLLVESAQDSEVSSENMKVFDQDGNQITSLHYNMTIANDETIAIAKSTTVQDMFFATLSRRGLLTTFKMTAFPTKNEGIKNFLLQQDWQINIAESLVQRNMTVKQDISYEQVVISKQKGKVRISVVDSENSFISFSKDSKFESLISLGDKPITQIISQQSYLVLLTDQHIKFLRFVPEKGLLDYQCSQVHGDQSTPFVSMAYDTSNPQVLYAATEKDIFVYETMQSKETKQTFCEGLGRLHLVSEQSKISSLSSTGSLLFALLDNSSLEVYPLTSNPDDFLSSATQNFNFIPTTKKHLLEVEQESRSQTQDKNYQIQSLDNHVVIKADQNQLLTIYSTFVAQKEEKQDMTSWLKFAPYIFMVLAFAGSLYYQSSRRQAKSADKEMENSQMTRKNAREKFNSPFDNYNGKNGDMTAEDYGDNYGSSQARSNRRSNPSQGRNKNLDDFNNIRKSAMKSQLDLDSQMKGVSSRLNSYQGDMDKNMQNIEKQLAGLSRRTEMIERASQRVTDSANIEELSSD